MNDAGLRPLPEYEPPARPHADDSLVAFLRARLGEKQQDAEATLYASSWLPYLLADIDAKRRIVDEHREEHGTCRVCAIRSRKYRAPCRTLRLLAEPFSGHPDYRDEWRL